MANKLREKTPFRTCLEKKKNYRHYKPNLADDFSCRCGYCNDHHMWSGGFKFYHIDHFAPKKFTTVACTYSNLVYSCPFCNISKSDDWVSDSYNEPIVGNKGYIDPCSPLYDAVLERNDLGEIRPLTPIGEYMYARLNLYLERHSIIWNLERLNSYKEELAASKDFIKDPSLRNAYIELDMVYSKLFRIFGDLR